MEELTQKKCIPCQAGAPRLTADEIGPLARQVPAWEVVDGRRLRRTIKTKDFADALALVNRIGALAEEEGHHPDLRLTWGQVDIDLWTHKIGGLHENDFILAAKIDRLLA